MGRYWRERELSNSSLLEGPLVPQLRHKVHEKQVHYACKEHAMARYMHMHVSPESPMPPKPRYDARYLEDTPTGANDPATIPWHPRARAIPQQVCKETALPASQCKHDLYANHMLPYMLHIL